jgi:acyl-CoA synthetase (AMP-forming)/AMP-acid ligase II
VRYVLCTLAAAKMGAIVAAISTFSTPRELAWSLEHCGAVAMITFETFRGWYFLDALIAAKCGTGEGQTRLKIRASDGTQR